MKIAFFSLFLLSMSLPVLASYEVSSDRGFKGFSVGATLGGSWGSASLEGQQAKGVDDFIQVLSGSPLPKLKHNGMLGGLNLGYATQFRNVYVGMDVSALLSGCKTDLKEYAVNLCEQVFVGLTRNKAAVDKFEGSTPFARDFVKGALGLVGKGLSAHVRDQVVEFSVIQKAVLDLAFKIGYVWNNKLLLGVKAGPTLSLYEVKQHLKGGPEVSMKQGMWGFTGGLFGAYKLSEKTSVSLNLDYRLTKTPTKSKYDILLQMKSFSTMVGFHYHF